MIRLGERQSLQILKKTNEGLFLSDSVDGQNVFLPAAETEEEMKAGDSIEVFVYKDNRQNLLSTTKQTRLEMGGIALLSVKSVTDFGAFLEWGLDKDLFLPFKEQRGTIKEGARVLVKLYVDKSGRLCATMKISNTLSSESPFKEGDAVWGTVYDINPEMGAFIAVSNLYHGMVPKREMFKIFQMGEKIEAWVDSAREDGKLNLTFRKKAYATMDGDADMLLEELKKNGGFLPFNDSSEPDEIRDRFGMSKRAFNRAVGRLFKQHMIDLEDGGIRLKQ
ncbi:MAG: RNA-binding protein [Clostridiales bacterium]|nr:MAG: RNA-binding protein [Clostridiales bacterium]